MKAKDFDPKAIKALAIDLDGTLLRPDKTLSERSLKALWACMEKGIKIIIATGRAVDSGEKYRKLIGASGPQVYYNGALVVDADTGKHIHKQYVDSEPILFCVRMARELGLYYQVFFPAGSVDIPIPKGQGSGDILMTERITAEAEKYTKSSGINIIIGDLEEHLTKVPAIIKGMFITSEENHQKLRSRLREKYGESLYIVQTTPVFLEVLAQGVSKGSGLEHALVYLNIQKEQTIAFGDEENDLPMFTVAGFSAAPVNAKENVRKAAMFQIPSESEDGVAAFLEERFG